MMKNKLHKLKSMNEFPANLQLDDFEIIDNEDPIYLTIVLIIYQMMNKKIIVKMIKQMKMRITMMNMRV